MCFDSKSGKVHRGKAQIATGVANFLRRIVDITHDASTTVMGVKTRHIESVGFSGHVIPHFARIAELCDFKHRRCDLALRSHLFHRKHTALFLAYQRDVSCYSERHHISRIFLAIHVGGFENPRIESERFRQNHLFNCKRLICGTTHGYADFSTGIDMTVSVQNTR